MVKKKENVGNHLEKAEQENRTLVLKYLKTRRAEFHGLARG